ncbi:MAG: putative major ferric iron binding protein [Candidatus Xenolissoclinum pacificiensis L6]|uniref:Major ferric iron binding protein n=1 Tax=Candidatus Xenolissoclinum pacificiensis L6 TaxID=1401685 RepID=W2UZK9_9RICK|nr:MAG: putative major ferric iron binding protein [Candidatus Xenolissoclinum pacificiensis L6]
MSKGFLNGSKWFIWLVVILCVLISFNYVFMRDKKGEEYVNVYSSRKEILVKEVFESFTRKYGIKVNYIIDDATKLIYRLDKESESPNADVLLVADVINLLHASQLGLLENLNSPVLNSRIPECFRATDWYGLTLRARVIAYSKDRVDINLLQNYEDCADPMWKGRILLRSSNVPYNQSLIASMIMANGEEATRRWVRGLVNNHTHVIRGGEVDKLKDIRNGYGDITFINSYYLARLYASQHKEERDLMDGIGILFPNQDNRGTMMNISGGAVIKGSTNHKNALLLLEFMVSKEAQEIYASINQEYPIVDDVDFSPVIRMFGSFKRDTRPLEKLEEHMQKAVIIADQEGWK